MIGIIKDFTFRESTEWLITDFFRQYLEVNLIEKFSKNKK